KRKIPKLFKDFIGDERAQNITFENYVGKVVKDEKKINKAMAKNLERASEIAPITTFDKLALGTIRVNAEGLTAQSEIAADRKEKAGMLQESLNEAAEYLKLNDAQVNQAKNGMFKKAQNGLHEVDESGLEVLSASDIAKLTQLANFARGTKKQSDFDFFQNEFLRIAPNRAKVVLKDGVKSYNELIGSSLPEEEANLRFFGIPKIDTQINEAKVNALGQKRAGVVTPIEDEGYKRSKVMDAFNQVLPYIRPSDAMELDPLQTMGERAFLASNHEVAVPAEKYNPQLKSPYNVSFQDMRNENTSDFRNIERQVGYNPAALSAMASQKYAANQKIGAEEFRVNQGIENQIYNSNIDRLNDAQYKNLGIIASQNEKQATAASNTKIGTQRALDSISSKILQDKLARKTLQTYENMYNYRFDNRGRAINWNGPVQYNIPDFNNVPKDQYGNPLYVPINGSDASTTANTTTAKNGTFIKSFKGL
uniref:hypothetical protein n=1 Tax=Algoriphagus sp. TaxID=1872435 RepID=UPI0025E41891